MKPIDFRLANYHSHTTRCMHASGTEEMYVRRAIESGFEILGFADHSAWPYRSDFVADMRMHISELKGYVDMVKALREKYADQLRVHLAMECEAFPEFYPWLEEIREEMGFDYFILGNHYDTTDENGGPYFGKCRDAQRAYRYMETTIAGMESGLFVYLAHPDLFLNQYPAFDADAKRISREICETAKRLDMPLEFNLLGSRRLKGSRMRGYMGYTTPEFWGVAAETGNRVIIGVDAHSPEDLSTACVQEYLQVRKMFSQMGLEVLEVLENVENKK